MISLVPQRQSDSSTKQLWPKALHRNTGDLLFPTELRVKKTHLHFLLFSQHYRQQILCCLPSPLGTVFQGNNSALLSCSATAVYNLLSSQRRCHICYAGFCCPIPYKGWLIRPLTFFFFFSTSRESQHQLPTTKSNDLLKLPSALTPTDHV